MLVACIASVSFVSQDFFKIEESFAASLKVGFFVGCREGAE